MAEENKKSKLLTKVAFLKWPEDLRKNLTPTYNAEDTHVIHAYCSVCKHHVQRIRQCYSGKLVNDVVTYGEKGTSWILRGNFERHMKSTGHIKCCEIQTGLFNYLLSRHKIRKNGVVHLNIFIFLFTFFILLFFRCSTCSKPSCT